MRVLIVDKTNEAQANCAAKLEEFSKSDREMLDLKVRLVNDREVLDRLAEADVMIIGAGVSEDAVSIARSARYEANWLQIIMFVGEREYGGGAFRSAHSVGVRKVFPENSSSLDLLQELVAIHNDFRKEGRASEGRVVAVVHAKGGVGATSVAAAIGEVCSDNNRRTLLWDLDVETKDLSRCLAASGPEAKVISSWINGSREISRESLRDALIPIANDVSVLTAPDRFAESMDLVCHADGMEISQRIIDLAKVLFDVVIIDTAGRMGPAVGGIIRNADIVLLVSDESEIGLTAMDLLLSSIKPLIVGSDRIRFLIRALSGSSVDMTQITADLESMHELNPVCWGLPVLPFDESIADWPGSGNTLFSMGNREVTRVFENIAQNIGVLTDSGTATSNDEDEREEQGSSIGLLRRLFSYVSLRG
jgi:MinD-like ATPase involved in chromosome partitioning or flagellar assembly